MSAEPTPPAVSSELRVLETLDRIDSRLASRPTFNEFVAVAAGVCVGIWLFVITFAVVWTIAGAAIIAAILNAGPPRAQTNAGMPLTSPYTLPAPSTPRAPVQTLGTSARSSASSAVEDDMTARIEPDRSSATNQYSRSAIAPTQLHRRTQLSTMLVYGATTSHRHPYARKELASLSVSDATSAMRDTMIGVTEDPSVAGWSSSAEYLRALQSIALSDTSIDQPKTERLQRGEIQAGDTRRDVELAWGPTFDVEEVMTADGLTTRCTWGDENAPSREAVFATERGLFGESKLLRWRIDASRDASFWLNQSPAIPVAESRR